MGVRASARRIPQLVLASASPARRRLLDAAGFRPEVCRSHFDESQVQLDDPEALVCELATCKARVVAQQFSDRLILGCDSVLVFEGEVHGKPPTPAAAIARWQRMRGRWGTLLTGHAAIDQLQGGREIVRCGSTQVHFAWASDRAIADYVTSGEPLQCAGAFALEGRGGLFVEAIEGCHTNVIGLSLPLLRELLQSLGYEPSDFWADS
ncbi:MAF protein [Rubidibacter lacunae KORDI 51-2]|uniref:Nucleoside triphosphate pyrophosphatase n=1 Tax=Rubidibacter lacunae KORDI 51-2 TaxID=582515 RepID=U5DLN6_9CHRO|nr:nucleoside triphosphate pyrophosphatase [Rubidibacter lacunae]ERN41802.1 MAF protein [Rubidibacter lacunae KORDI 51-2]